ncbi:MAG: hypothetical protein IT178_12215 [Acidobacteria bacterium]|nr:hypothetical protein [Acidobacteriota bacterium]
MTVRDELGPFARRLQTADLLWTLAAAATALTAGVVVSRFWPAALNIGVAGAVVVLVAGVWRTVRAWTIEHTALAIETRTRAFDNLLITAVELAPQPAARMRPLVEAAARERLSGVAPGDVAPLRTPALAAIAIIIAGVVAAVLINSRAIPSSEFTSPIGSAATPGTLRAVRVVVTPPGYLQREAEIVSDAAEVRVPEGGRVRLDVEADTPLAWVESGDGTRTPLDAAGDGRFLREWTPAATETWAIAAGPSLGDAAGSRLLTLTVVPDAAPEVRIAAPGRDLTFPTPKQSVAIELTARDAEGLSALELRYTRLSGSGETFEFTEGRVPVAITRKSPTSWSARVDWPLASTGMEDGDSLVYRAAVRDTRPGRDWTFSDSFTIDVGKRLEFAGAGFAIPEEDRRYAISQQMVIVKTERLIAESRSLEAETVATRARELAVEQRMVRAEVVFLSGGEVEDEVAEAEHSHELQEGRLENRGRAEMLRALNEMSRAEALLNGTELTAALAAEKAAMAALQRAFDRRRYFLRTLSERSRIDTTRRLTGNRSTASSFTRPDGSAVPDLLADERRLMRELAEARASDAAPETSVLVRLAGLAGDADAWATRAAAIARAGSADERRPLIDEAMAALSARARARLGPSGASSIRSDDALRGWWADAWREGSRR